MSIAALRAHGVKRRIAVVEPYFPVIQPKIESFFAEFGYEVVRFNHLQGPQFTEYARMTARDMIAGLKRIDGPYVDRAGAPMLDGGGSLFVGGGHGWAAGGGPGFLRTAAGVDDTRMVLHAYDGQTGAPYLQLVDVAWQADGWPAAVAAASARREERREA